MKSLCRAILIMPVVLALSPLVLASDLIHCDVGSSASGSGLYAKHETYSVVIEQRSIGSGYESQLFGRIDAQLSQAGYTYAKLPILDTAVVEKSDFKNAIFIGNGFELHQWDNESHGQT